MAPPVTSTTPRSIEWTFTDPLFSPESNRSAWWTLSEATGALDEFVGVKLEQDLHPWYRAVSLIGNTLFTSLFTHYSHEVAHMHADAAFGVGGGLAVAPDLTFGFLPRPLLLEQWYPHKQRGERWQNIDESADGLSQQNLNAHKLHAAALRTGRVAPDRGINLLLSNAFVFGYVIASGDDSLGATYDPAEYRKKLQTPDTPDPVSFAEHVGWSTAAFLLDGRNVESLLSVMHYAATGRRDAAPLSVALGESTRLYWPTVQLWHHPEGLLLAVDTPLQGVIHPHDQLTVHASAGVAGWIDCARFGFSYESGRYHPHWAVPLLSTATYTTVWLGSAPYNPFRRSIGVVTSLDLSWELPKNFQLGFHQQVSLADPIQSDIFLKGISESYPYEAVAYSWSLTVGWGY